ncbi:MAG TPA: hypothetical protein PKX68_07235 [Ignavibacteriaceae bacterium]|nr:hypothetical protein [Ignavibacteriaceae bacterium]
MNNKFSPSVNIVRDKAQKFEYIPTPNAERVLQNLNESISRGIKSFYLVGSFGTGKSSFLLALENQVENGKKIFRTPLTFNGSTKYKSFNVIGDYRSLEDTLREELKINKRSDVIEALGTHYNKVNSSKKGLLIAIDEFGKFLEYASENKPERELYIVQKLAEFANDPTKNIIFLTTLHQGFEAYRSKLDEKSRNEWEKVKGRLKEIAFNEPVEQLLHLAAKYLNGKLNNVSHKEFSDLYKSIISSRVYPLYNSLNEKIAEQLYPLEILSAGILARSLQRYGQNERSLFTFLETNNFNKNIYYTKPYFNLVDVFDYLINNYYSLLSSKYNPDYLKWTIINSTLERAEVLFEKEYVEKEKLIKVIGLLNILAPSGSKINTEFLIKYGNLALNISHAENEIKTLEKNKLIRFQSYSDSYVLFEGTDVDIDLALNDAENYLNHSPDLVSKLKEYFNFPYLPAKASYIKKGTPRFYEFIISDYPVQQRSKGESDGIINLIFNENIDLDKIKSVSKSIDEAILYGVYENAELIKTTILEIDKANYVLDKYADDRVVKREIKNLIEQLTIELNELVVDSLFFKDSKVQWIFNGKVLNINSKTAFNKKLSEIIDIVCNKTPIIHNELINREKLPSAINLARKELFKNLFDYWDKSDLGFDKNKFPPEKTIYLSLLKNTGIHKKESNVFILTEPSDKSFKDLWDCCEEFFSSTKSSKKSLVDLVDILSDKPFKLKKGFIDFWLPLYLFIKRDDYALFDGEVYIPTLSIDLIEMILKNPKNYFIKAFDVQGIKFELFNRYRNLLNKSKEEKITSNSFVDTIRPFLTFYRSLPEYTKKTNRISREALSLRNAISNAKDPEKTFFEDFPSALGYTTQKLYTSDKYLEGYVNKLQDCIRELRLAFDDLVNRIEKNIIQILGLEKLEFPLYKEQIISRYSEIKTYLMLPYQRAIYQRVNSELNDKKSWLSSIVQGLIGKSLELLTDEEEEIVYEKFMNLFHEFDSLNEFANLEIDNKIEDAYKIEITSVSKGFQKSIVRLTKQQEKEARQIEKKIKENLSSNKKVNQIALLNILEREIDDTLKEDKEKK